MKKPMNQFLDALRGLEKARTPLDEESQVSKNNTLDSSGKQISDLNRLETEEDGPRQAALRIAKLRQQAEVRRSQKKEQ